MQEQKVYYSEPVFLEDKCTDQQIKATLGITG